MAHAFILVKLSEKNVEFLNNYTPEDDMFTSEKEMEQITEALALNTYTDVEGLRAVRNTVVKFYYDQINKEIVGKQRTENFWKVYERATPAMQSITAVIDHKMYHINSASV